MYYSCDRGALLESPSQSNQTQHHQTEAAPPWWKVSSRQADLSNSQVQTKDAEAVEKFSSDLMASASPILSFPFSQSYNPLPTELNPNTFHTLFCEYLQRSLCGYDKPMLALRHRCLVGTGHRELRVSRSCPPTSLASKTCIAVRVSSGRKPQEIHRERHRVLSTRLKAAKFPQPMVSWVTHANGSGGKVPAFTAME
ncbi:hypothetical protein RRG08_041996 [Elysia crispata]|uniref:Uncharacterized protein n=1 Tax=Elysia crispata TaxID=231223 RepID=A0AAE1D817_9GAST|nr:hypothetical protein RRG08_041996 [Elysia crispata]